ncbi:MAG: cupin domain-containing protein [Candidatus Paceibacterota bacterium]
MSAISKVKSSKYPQINALISHLVLAGSNTPEISLVEMRPKSVIEPHIHKVDARMFIVSGTATVLSDDGNNGTVVRKGDCVFFEKLRRHGFKAGPEGMTFLSINGGIRKIDGELDFVS